MVHRRLASFACLAAFFVLVSPAAAAKWRELGTRTVTDRLDHDTIVVTGAAGNFDAIVLEVRRVAVQFHSVTIHFGNGSVQRLDLRSVVPAGGRTRVIDIDGKDRVIHSVEFWYDAQSLHGKEGVVRLFGRH